MKNYLKLMVTSLFVLGLWSCSEESFIENGVYNPSETELLNRVNEIANLTDTEIVIEYMTVEELNAAMIEHGLPPYTEKELASTNQKYSCPDADILGDWSKFFGQQFCIYSGTITVSVIDLILARNYMFANGGPNGAISGIPWNNYPGCVSENFGVISYLAGEGGLFTVDPADLTVVRDFILGRCN